MKLARGSLGVPIASWLFRYAAGVVPGLVFRDEKLLIIRHPRPIAEGHLVAVPRCRVEDVTSRLLGRQEFLSALEPWLRANRPGSRFVTNVGSRQEVRLLHIHVLPPAKENMLQQSLMHPTLVAALDQAIEMLGPAGEVSGSRLTGTFCGLVPRSVNDGWTVRFVGD